MRAYVIATCLMLLAYLSFYARYFAWAGDFAWGDRYVSTSVELVALMAIPLLLKYRHEAGRAVWIMGMVLLVVSALIQIESLMFWLPLEIHQEETLGHPTFVIALRAGKYCRLCARQNERVGFEQRPDDPDPWDYMHITCWNFLPFLLGRVGEAPAWVVRVAFAIWFTALAALAATLVRIRQVATHSPRVSAQGDTPSWQSRLV